MLQVQTSLLRANTHATWQISGISECLKRILLLHISMASNSIHRTIPRAPLVSSRMLSDDLRDLCAHKDKRTPLTGNRPVRLLLTTARTTNFHSQTSIRDLDVAEKSINQCIRNSSKETCADHHGSTSQNTVPVYNHNFSLRTRSSYGT